MGDHATVTRRTASTVLVALLLAAAGCGGDDPDGNAARGSTTAVQGERGAFCSAWNAAIVSGDDAAVDAVLDGAPAELEEAAAVVREAEASGSESPEAEAAVAEILNWTALQCEVGGPGPSQRRVAPTIDAAFDGLTFCSTTSLPLRPDDSQSGMLLYGADDAGDPYDGSMLGVVWNRAGDGGHAGDGDAGAVTVRGEPGVAAPITVFQQTVLPELGTVIAWTEGDRAIGLYGRGWPMERADELLAIADRLEESADGFRLPADALPDGYSEVFSGNPSVTSLVLTPSPLYSVRYQSADGLLDVTGMRMTAGEFEAFRFFTVGVDEGAVGGRDGLLGNAWGADGPAVVTWRESDGLVIRIVGLGVPLDVASQVATAARELTEAEWAALVEADDQCGEL